MQKENQSLTCSFTKFIVGRQTHLSVWFNLFILHQLFVYFSSQPESDAGWFLTWIVWLHQRHLSQKIIWDQTSSNNMTICYPTHVSSSFRFTCVFVQDWMHFTFSLTPPFSSSTLIVLIHAHVSGWSCARSLCFDLSQQEQYRCDQNLIELLWCQRPGTVLLLTAKL